MEALITAESMNLYPQLLQSHFNSDVMRTPAIVPRVTSVMLLIIVALYATTAFPEKTDMSRAVKIEVQEFVRKDRRKVKYVITDPMDIQFLAQAFSKPIDGSPVAEWKAETVIH